MVIRFTGCERKPGRTALFSSFSDSHHSDCDIAYTYFIHGRQKPMKATLKLSSEERRAAIIKAVQRVFAEKGFDGTTTRELAEEAGVSEALLFKHFPNKEALYSAMQTKCCQGKDPAIERLKTLEPSTSALVTLVHFMFSR